MPRKATTPKKRTSKVLDAITMETVICHLSKLGYVIANQMQGSHLMKVEMVRKNQRTYIVGRC